MATLFPNTPLGAVLSDPSPAATPKRHKILQGKYVSLEPLDATKHAASLYTALCEHPSTRIATDGSAWPGWAYLPVGPFTSQADFIAQIEAYSAMTDPFFYAVVVKRNIPSKPSAADSATTPTTTTADTAVGWLSLLNIETAHQSVEVGHVAFSPVLQRTVESTEAFYLVIRHTLEDLGNRRLEWKCDALNAPSRRAAARLGMTYEGTFRKHRIVRGRNRDTAWFSIVDDEWFGEGGRGDEGAGGLRRAFAKWLAEDNFDEGGVQKRTLEEVRAALRG